MRAWTPVRASCQTATASPSASLAISGWRPARRRTGSWSARGRRRRRSCAPGRWPSLARPRPRRRRRRLRPGGRRRTCPSGGQGPDRARGRRRRRSCAPGRDSSSRRSVSRPRPRRRRRRLRSGGRWRPARRRRGDGRREGGARNRDEAEENRERCERCNHNARRRLRSAFVAPIICVPPFPWVSWRRIGSRWRSCTGRTTMTILGRRLPVCDIYAHTALITGGS